MTSGCTPDEPIRGGIAIIKRGRRYLVRQRPAGTVYAGYWEFPGGKCEPGESPAAATARECLEEIGLAIAVGPRRTVVFHRYPHGLVELHFFDCTTVDESAAPAAELDFHWLLATELLKLRFPEANEAIITELAREESAD
jgi:8-oxo-dGTP diphosphatase